MKILTYLFIFFPIIVKAQLLPPYAQNFEDFSFYQNDNVNLDVNAPQLYCNDEVSVDVVGGFGYSWNLATTYSTIGKALKLSVHEHDHVKSALHPRSRSEVTFLIDNDSSAYYSYWIYIPNDSEFIENITPDSYHIIQQIQSSMWNEELNQPYNLITTNLQGDLVNTSDMLGALVYYYSNTPGNVRDLEFWANDPKDSKAHSLGEMDEETYKRSRKVMKIRGGFKKGDWNEIIIKINWSRTSTEGFYQFWINRRPIILDYQVVGYPFFEYEVIPGLPNMEPFKLYTGNITITNDNFPIKTPSLLKLGHYRNNHSHTQSLYIDDFRISYDFPPDYLPPGSATKLIDSQCGSVLFADDLILTAKNVQNAINYKFRFRKPLSLTTYIIESPGPFVDISNDSFFDTNKSYIVDISVNNGAFGAQCTITTPYLTELTDKYCNQTLGMDSWTVEAKKLPFTNEYKFHFKRMSDNSHIWIDKDQPLVNLKDDGGYSGFFIAGATYEVEVAKPIHAYGEKCNLTLSNTTKLTDTYCGQTLSHNDLRVYAYPVPNVSNYKFRFARTGIVTFPYIMTSVNPFVDLSTAPYFTTGATYNVEVSVDGGMTYGSICEIKTPYLTKLKNDKCNSQLSSWVIEANSLPFTNQYKFYFKRKDTGSEYWIDKAIPQVILSDAGNYSGYFVPGKTYEVKVAKPIHAYGDMCEITLPLAKSENEPCECEECLPLLDSF